MDIDKILSDLGLDFSNPETKRGALEAIEAIASSRAPQPDLGSALGGMGGIEMDVELDPDLIQPSVKHSPTESDDDVEIEDEEDLLSQMKHNDSEQDFDDADQTDGAGDGSTSSSSDSSGSDESDPNVSSGSNNDNASSEGGDDTDIEDDTEDDSSASSEKSVADDERDSDTGYSEEDGDEGSDNSSSEEDEDDLDSDGWDSDEETDDFGAEEDEDSGIDSQEETDDERDEFDSDESLNDDDLEGTESTSEEDEDDVDEEDEDYLDDEELDHTFDDKEATSKNAARAIKRERTIAAGKKALEDAKAKKAAPAIIKELESAIAALEALTEAVKSIKDISDDEFNLMVNRVFDAIDAVGDKSLTFSTDEEREAKVKEIKADMESEDTRAELSAEDVAKIRAEHQAQKAREKETAKYQARARTPFKGFQEFLNSLYRAVALQVNVDEVNDSTWSAISRRNSGVGVLQQGKRINELPNKKIPVIDFYFDQSGSWNDNDIKVGEKAVSALADMEAEGKIKINIYYFSNDVYTNAASARADGGTAGWNEIVKNIIATQATNVIIMTDSDMENWWHGDTALRYTVPGYVWYLWRDGINAPRLPRDLKGRGGTQQFAFSASDA